jgi:hypothetical protein
MAPPKLERRSGAPEEVRAPDSGFEAGTGVKDSDYLDFRLLLRVDTAEKVESNATVKISPRSARGELWQ